MGNCRSKAAASPSTAAPLAVQNKPPVTASPPKILSPSQATGTSTSALIQSLLPVVLPIVRRVISQQCVAQKMVLFQEKKVDSSSTKNIMGPLEVNLHHINVVDAETMEKDMAQMPEFEWPEKQRCRSLMTSRTRTASSIEDEEKDDNDEKNMVVLDVTGVTLTACLEPGIELEIPVEGPMGMKANVELGSGGSIPHAKFYVEVPKLRIWFVNDPKYKLHVAFMARPKILPQVHVNVDRGRGDFLELEFDGAGGGLDDTIESVLCGFGPSSLTRKRVEAEGSSKKESRSWVADALGKQISEAMGAFAGIGKNRPLEIDLDEAIQAGIDAALGKTRSVEAIEADMKVLQAELEVAKKKAQEEAPPKPQPQPQTPTKTRGMPTDEKKEEDKGKGRFASYFILEEEDATKATAEVAPSCFFCGVGV